MADILLGVTGSIAAYKACELASALRKQGHTLTAILTSAGKRLVSSYALRTLTGNPVVDDIFPSLAPESCPHIAATDRADLLVVAPATANFLAKAAHGIADDALSTTLLSVRCPVLVAPAMNHRMWFHPAVQDNLLRLRERGLGIVEPEAGLLACGWEGKGRLAPVPTILARIDAALAGERAPRGLPVRVVCDGPLPAYHSADAAGLDLCAREAVALEPGASAKVPTGLRVELPPGYEAQVRPRSGLAARHGLTVLNAPGTIDADYRGEIAVLLINLGEAAYAIEAGERIAQLVVARHARVAWEPVSALGESARGEGGFGSTDAADAEVPAAGDHVES